MGRGMCVWGEGCVYGARDVCMGRGMCVRGEGYTYGARDVTNKSFICYDKHNDIRLIMVIIIPNIIKNQLYWLKDNHMT